MPADTILLSVPVSAALHGMESISIITTSMDVQLVHSKRVPLSAHVAADIQAFLASDAVREVRLLLFTHAGCRVRARHSNAGTHAARGR